MTPTEELIAALRALADGYDMHILEGRYLRVANPKFAEDNGENPWLVIDTHDLRLSSLTAPVEGMTLETTAEERASVLDGKSGQDMYYARITRDFDLLSSALAAERAMRQEADRIGAMKAEQYAAERDRNERLVGALTEIDQWSQAYPLTVFPEPDFAKAAEVLKAAGMTLDAISASNMRHVVEGVGKIARTALSQEKQT